MKHFLALRKALRLRPTPHGVGGLKPWREVSDRRGRSPTPHGVGGLKRSRYTLLDLKAEVPPRTGWVD